MKIINNLKIKKFSSFNFNKCRKKNYEKYRKNGLKKHTHTHIEWTNVERVLFAEFWTI